MNTLLEKVGSFQSVRSIKTTSTNHGSSGSADSWPAPARRQNPLVLKRSPGGSASPLPEPFCTAPSSTVAPFPSPVQTSAFDLPRPVVAVDTSSAWTRPGQKWEALALRRDTLERAEAEFMRPHFFGEKLSARHPWQLCRSC